MFDGLLSWLRDQWAAIIAALDGLVPAVPPEWADACRSVADAVAWIEPIRALVPFGALAVGLGIVITGAVAGFVIILVRMGVSVAALGGGAV